MRTIKHNVSIRDKVTKVTKVVTTLDIDVYDTLDELLATYEEADIVSNFNRQKIQDLANKARVAFRQGPSRKAQDAEILRFLTTPEQVARLAACAGNAEAIERLHEEVRAELFPDE